MMRLYAPAARRTTHRVKMPLTCSPYKKWAKFSDTGVTAYYFTLANKPVFRLGCQHMTLPAFAAEGRVAAPCCSAVAA